MSLMRTGKGLSRRVCTWKTRPSSDARSFAASRTAGLKRSTWPTVSGTPMRAACRDERVRLRQG